MHQTPKTAVSFILTLLLLSLALCACADAEAAYAQAMRAYAAVLRNEAEFFCADGGEYYEPAEGRFTLLHAYAENSVPSYSLEAFAVVDLDQDGVPEVVLSMLHENFLEVLHYDAGIVYGYLFPSRAMMDLQQDGTFGFSGGVVEGGYARLTFAPPGYVYVEIESGGEGETVAWYDYTPESIRDYIAQ